MQVEFVGQEWAGATDEAPGASPSASRRGGRRLLDVPTVTGIPNQDPEQRWGEGLRVDRLRITVQAGALPDHASNRGRRDGSPLWEIGDRVAMLW